jgi:hypothetical protein
MKAENIARIKQARIDYEVAQTIDDERIFYEIWDEIMADEIAQGGVADEINAEMCMACNVAMQGR